MNYQIWGEPMPAVTIRLEQGESIYTQSGGMSWMTDSIEMDTNLRGGLFKGLGRMFSGESLFMATYTASRPAQEITLASSFPGQILALQISRGQQYICQKSAFLCAQQSVELSAEIVKGFPGVLFGREGFVCRGLRGAVIAFYGHAVRVLENTLANGHSQ